MADPEPYATADEVRAYESALSSPTEYTDEYLTDLIAEFEQLAERYIGIAYAVRETVETVRMGGGPLVLQHRPIVEVTSVSANDTPVDVTDYTVDRTAGVLGYGWTWFWSWWVYPVVVAYTYGNPTPPPGLKRACLEFVRATALQKTSGLSRDTIYQSNDGGSTRYLQPDTADHPTGYREVDRILNTLKDCSAVLA